jgi:hypothetical protein
MSALPSKADVAGRDRYYDSVLRDGLNDARPVISRRRRAFCPNFQTGLSNFEQTHPSGAR